MAICDNEYKEAFKTIKSLVQLPFSMIQWMINMIEDTDWSNRKEGETIEYSSDRCDGESSNEKSNSTTSREGDIRSKHLIEKVMEFCEFVIDQVFL